MYPISDTQIYKDIHLQDNIDTPNDSISALLWGSSIETPGFFCSSWDATLRYYQIIDQNNAYKLSQKFMRPCDNPLLSIAINVDCSVVYTGDIAGTIDSIDMVTGQSKLIGVHSNAVKGLYYLPNHQTLCSLSYDRTIRFWDHRQQELVGFIKLDYKPFNSDLSDMTLAVGLSSQKLLFANLTDVERMMAKPESLDVLDSPLGKNSQITSIGLFADRSGFGIGSEDSRASLSKSDNDRDRFGKIKLITPMIFKCHRIEAQSNMGAYVVHGIGFNPRSSSFMYTIGGDGSMVFWDQEKKTLIKKFTYKNVPVNCAKMSLDGRLLCYSIGYDWCRGYYAAKNVQTNLAVHLVDDKELAYGIN